MNEEEFQKLWNELVDWAGSGFRYQQPDFTARGLDTMKIKFDKFSKQCFQAGRASAVSEIREKKPKKKELRGTQVNDMTNVGIYGFNQYSDELDKILEGMEK